VPTSYHNTIATSCVSVIGALSGAPTTIKRKVMWKLEEDSLPICIVTMGSDRYVLGAFGGLIDTTGGTVIKEYEIVVTLLRAGNWRNETAIGDNPDFMLAIKQALNKVPLSGATSVVATRIGYDQEFLAADLEEGYDASQIVIVFTSTEPRLG
jgi:hypothetical protein